jgi:hypothetical protein
MHNQEAHLAPRAAAIIVAVCKACGLIGAIDAQLKEVNGMVFRVTCRTNSYKISE